MKTLDKVCEWSFYIIGVIAVICTFYIHSKADTGNIDTRDYNYESYCDSVWQANPDYYLDVLVETNEFQEYIELNGEWWDD